MRRTLSSFIVEVSKVWNESPAANGSQITLTVIAKKSTVKGQPESVIDILVVNQFVTFEGTLITNALPNQQIEPTHEIQLLTKLNEMLVPMVNTQSIPEEVQQEANDSGQAVVYELLPGRFINVWPNNGKNVQ